MKEITDELEAVKFHRLQILKRPQAQDLPTLEDADEHKLPALNRLLKQMLEFNSEMNSVGLKLTEDNDDQRPQKNLFQLTDSRFSKICTLQIILKSNWFDPKYGIALHGGFKFHLHINQEIHPEISDWLRIDIVHLDTTPFSFASEREYDRYLSGPCYRGRLFFEGIALGPIKLGPKERNFNTINSALSFSTSTLNRCVNDACAIMQALIRDKNMLIVEP